MSLEKAILKLRPNSEFRIENNDYATIEWFALNGDAPTVTEINEAIEQIKADEVAEAQAKAQAKAALLAQLGITEEQAKLLLS